MVYIVLRWIFFALYVVQCYATETTITLGHICPLETNDIGDQEIGAAFDVAIDAALEGKNVFITGVAGTGKSKVTEQIVQNAKDRPSLFHNVFLKLPKVKNGK